MINPVAEILEEIRDELEKSPYLDGSTVIAGYPSAIKDVPLRRSVIAVSIGSVELEHGALGGYFGRSERGEEICGRKCRLEVRMDIAVPKLLGGEVCHEMLGALVSALIAGETGSGAVSVRAGEIRVDRALGALILPATLTVDAVIREGTADAGEAFDRFIVRMK